MRSKSKSLTSPTRLPEFMKKLTPCPGMKDEMPVASSIMAHICLLNSVLERAGDRTAAQHGLTMTQWFALGCIGHAADEGLMHSELGQRLMLSKAPITGVVDRLEKGGYVMRFADGHDRRVSRIKITPKGTETWLEVRGSLRELSEDICAGFSDAQLHQSQEFLARLLENAVRTDSTTIEKTGDKS